jgi:hypothetical protein
MNICVLRVSGAEFAVDDFVTTSKLTSDSDLFSVWHKGEPRRNGNCEDSGFIMDICEVQSEGLKEQTEKVRNILSDNYEEIKKLMEFPGVENGILDFAIAKRDVAAQVDLFPAGLVNVAGSLSLGLMKDELAGHDQVNNLIDPRVRDPRVRF